ncbi:Small ribosomal subunit biogenesis, partial [Dipsacomyces acuminosporus]
MVLPATSANNVKVYTVSGSNLSRKIPDWLARRKRRELQKDIEWTTRIELIQDFAFPEASLRIKTTPDGEFCMATGVYKPQIRVYDFAHMSMKFDRHTDSENVNFLIISDDWTKT